MQIGQFEEYIKGKYGAVIQDGGLRNANGTKQGITIQFEDGVAQATRDLVTAEIATYGFTPAPPNFPKFIADVFTDATLTRATRETVSQMGLWYINGQKKLALMVWQALSGGGSAATIRQHATNNNFTLP